MTSDPANAPESSTAEGVLERLTALVLLVVVLALGWMIAAAYLPDNIRFASAETEVILMTGLLAAALTLVSLVALRHTREHRINE